MASTTYSKWQVMWPIMRRAFMLQNDKITRMSPMSRLFNIEATDADQEQFDGVGGLGLMPAYNGEIEFDTFGKYPKTTIEFPEYAKGIAVPRKLIDDDKTGSIQRQFTSLGANAARTMDSHAASVFNNAFDTDYAGADTYPLCSASHPLSADNTTAQINAGSSALTQEAVIQTIKDMQAFEDDRGELLGIDPNILLVPRGLQDTAWVIKNSLGKPGTAENDANFLVSRPLTVIVWHRLSDQNNWFMLDSEEAMMHLHWLNRIPVDVAYNPASDFNLKLEARSYARWGYGWDYPFFIFGHEVAA